MRSDLIELADLTADDRSQWRALAARAVEPNPFHEPEYVLPLAAGLAPRTRMALAVVRDAAGWQACAPVHSGRWHRVPMRAVTTWRSRYTFLGTPLVSPDRTGEALAELVAGMLASRHPAFAALDWVADDGPVAEALTEALPVRQPAPLRFERFERATVRRREQPTYLEESLSAKRRRELRRQSRKLGEALGAELVTVDRASEEAAHQRFIELEAAGWKGSGGTALAAAPGDAAFFREMCRGFAEQGRLQLLFLEADGEPVAGQCNLIGAGTIFSLKVAYDERWARFSPGIQLELEALKTFHERPELELMDSCSDPTNRTINRLWPDRRSLATHVFPATGPKGMLAAPSIRLLRSLRESRDRRRSR